jgi:hypothetical protein
LRTQLEIQSIQDSLRRGALVELSSDYRTAGALRAHLPRPAQCAMSSTAFRQYVLQGTTAGKLSRVEAICAVLGTVLKLNGESPGGWFEFRFFGEDGRPQSVPLKLEWFAPDKHWVVLLPNEQLRAVAKSR